VACGVTAKNFYSNKKRAFKKRRFLKGGFYGKNGIFSERAKKRLFCA